MTKLKRQENQLHKKLIKENPDRIKKVITEDDLGEYIITAKRIKVIPVNKESQKTINDAIAISRKLWNKCVTEIQKHPNTTYEELRDKFVTKIKMNAKSLKELSWTFRIQQKVREAIPRKFSANYKTAQDNFEKLSRKFFYKRSKKSKKKKKKVKKKIVMQFREKTDEKQVIYLNKEICKFRVCETTGKTILETFNGVELTLQENYTNFNTETTCTRCQHIFSEVSALKKHMNNKKPCKRVDINTVPKAGIPQAEMILQRVGYTYYLFVPEYIKPNIKEEAPNDIAGVDVGYKTFATYFSPHGEWGEICPDMKLRLDALYTEIDSIKYWKMGKKNGKKKNNKATQKARRKAIKKRKKYITNMINDLHWKICHWLLSKFRKIVISRLYVSKSNKDNKRIQADLRLCTFVDRLIHKSIEYKNSEIHVCKEHYTTKACTNCLSINTIVNDTVKCNDCNHEIHRDLAGARNIFMKHCY